MLFEQFCPRENESQVSRVGNSRAVFVVFRLGVFRKPAAD